MQINKFLCIFLNFSKYVKKKTFKIVYDKIIYKAQFLSVKTYELTQKIIYLHRLFL
jgi:hypothetical protein